MDPVPDPLLLKKACSAGNRTRDLWICSQELLTTRPQRYELKRRNLKGRDLFGDFSVNGKAMLKWICELMLWDSSLWGHCYQPQVLQKVDNFLNSSENISSWGICSIHLSHMIVTKKIRINKITQRHISRFSFKHRDNLPWPPSSCNWYHAQSEKYADSDTGEINSKHKNNTIHWNRACLYMG